MVQCQVPASPARSDVGPGALGVIVQPAGPSMPRATAVAWDGPGLATCALTSAESPAAPRYTGGTSDSDSLAATSCTGVTTRLSKSTFCQAEPPSDTCP